MAQFHSFAALAQHFFIPFCFWHPHHPRDAISSRHTVDISIPWVLSVSDGMRHSLFFPLISAAASLKPISPFISEATICGGWPPAWEPAVSTSQSPPHPPPPLLPSSSEVGPTRLKQVPMRRSLTSCDIRRLHSFPPPTPVRPVRASPCWLVISFVVVAPPVVVVVAARPLLKPPPAGEPRPAAGGTAQQCTSYRR